RSSGTACLRGVPRSALRHSEGHGLSTTQTTCWKRVSDMLRQFDSLAFRPADILLPRECEYRKWSVVACDQYTSQPDYWQRVEEYVGAAPSTLRLILPETCLDGPNVETDIMEVNNTMTRYLRE